LFNTRDESPKLLNTLRCSTV